MSDNNDSNSGMGFLELLTIVFIALKLTNIIAWSWFWVLSPIIIPVIIGFFIIMIAI